MRLIRSILRLRSALVITVGLGLLLSASLPSPVLAIRQPAARPRITGFKGVRNGEVIQGTVGIEARVVGKDIAWVVFQLTGPQSARHVEYNAPYVFFGDMNRSPRGWDTTHYPNGDYLLTVIATDHAQRSVTRSVSFQIGNTGRILFDTFDRDELGPTWKSFEWSIVDGQLSSNLGGYGDVRTTSVFPQTSFVIETQVTGLQPGTGPSPWDTIYLTFGGDMLSVGQYRVAYFTSFGPQFVLLRRELLPNGEIGETVLAAAPFSAAPDTPYTVTVIRDGMSGLIQVYISQTIGAQGAPLLEATDTMYPILGSFGWGIERESPGNVYVDWIAAEPR